MNMAIERASVVGDGAMGTLCSMLLSGRGSKVLLWGRDPEHVATISEARENRRFLPGYTLDDQVTLVSDDGQAFQDCSIIISAVPCQHLRSVWSRLKTHVPQGVPVISVTKGIEVDTLTLPTDVIRECLGDVSVACLSGPCIAPEVAAQKPATVVVASHDEVTAELVQKGMSASYFRVYTSNDLIGVEVAAAAKNVIALAAGMCDGLGAGDNAKASLLTRGLVEITRLGVAMGAREATFRGLAGVGDLFTTCVSKIGRNRSAGERLGRGESVDQVIASTESVIEGIPTTRSVLELARRKSVELPIVSAMAEVLFEGRCPDEAVEELMTRPLRSE
ncbi:MAG: NAD(P)H-dependent glycerol-3-phosphate dehydrogenase [Planctomycetota bacterium]|jgi:glycerol-3-phosphate dehydrogenase (NAD(P)+)